VLTGLAYRTLVIVDLIRNVILIPVLVIILVVLDLPLVQIPIVPPHNYNVLMDLGFALLPVVLYRELLELARLLMT